MSNWISLLFKIHIHPVFWFVLGIGILTASFKQLIVLFLIVFIHELGHAVAAHLFSWRIKSILLLPFGGVAEMDEHGNRPLHEELIVVLSGPLQHVWMALAGYGLYTADVLSADLFHLFMIQNVTILLFNLLPIWPLDGGKVLFIMLSHTKPFIEAHKQALYISTVSLAILILISSFLYFQQFHLWVIISFLIISLYKEWKDRYYVYIRFLLERYQGRKLEISSLRPLTVPPEEPLHTILQRFQRGCKHIVIVEGKESTHQQVDENEILHAYFTEKRIHSPINELVPFY
ncbi:M50 family metallopeptidase [Priestia koreensis]|uniref:Stage IV sporulation protein FB n=1 Tax=Priestia koreensis TaxID=284581 RepID=A0A0M0L7J4_9BACI|nr:M50 family metallopeptidase [Priestia koreensis]KOO46974.1 stage IV sporulation protein FB [Priestia koreensis]